MNIIRGRRGGENIPHQSKSSTGLASLTNKFHNILASVYKEINMRERERERKH
jgi:hypothetical protein